MDDDDHVLDPNDLSNGMDHAEDAWGTAGYVVARGVGRGMGAGNIVSYSDLVGARSPQIGATTFQAAQCFACAKLTPKYNISYYIRMDRYEQYMPTISGKKIEGYGISTYCKITETYPIDSIHYRCDFAFGTGLKKFCMIATYDAKNPDSIYIDRVENNKACLIQQDITQVGDGTAKLVRLGLYEMYRRKPTITRFTLKDDSNIYCNGADYGERISMSYETLLKYNQTWYQQKFGAVLPGFVSSTTGLHQGQEEQGIIRITLPINGESTTFRVKTDSSMLYFLQSLSNLDQPSTPYEAMVRDLPKIAAFRTEYESAATPREFMARVRAAYKDDNGKFDKKGYCLAVAPWFSFYIKTLRIPLYYDQWYIPVEAVTLPDEFKEEPVANAVGLLHGGRHKRSTLHHTRRKSKSDQWGIIPYYPTGRRFGGTEEL